MPQKAPTPVPLRGFPLLSVEPFHSSPGAELLSSTILLVERKVVKKRPSLRKRKKNCILMGSEFLSFSAAEY